MEINHSSTRLITPPPQTTTRASFVHSLVGWARPSPRHHHQVRISNSIHSLVPPAACNIWQQQQLIRASSDDLLIFPLPRAARLSLPAMAMVVSKHNNKRSLVVSDNNLHLICLISSDLLVQLDPSSSGIGIGIGIPQPKLQQHMYIYP
jgi:hypothetical protein